VPHAPRGALRRRARGRRAACVPTDAGVRRAGGLRRPAGVGRAVAREVGEARRLFVSGSRRCPRTCTRVRGEVRPGASWSATG
jgi:hypothetical protein